MLAYRLPMFLEKVTYLLIYCSSILAKTPNLVISLEAVDFKDL